LTYRRTNHDNMHVRGYKEEGTTTTPFDMCVLNQIDRFNLVTSVLGTGRARRFPLSRNEILNNPSLKQGEAKCPAIS